MGNPPAAHGPFAVNFKGQLFRQGSGRIEVTSTEDPGVLQAPQHNPFLKIREVERNAIGVFGEPTFTYSYSYRQPSRDRRVINCGIRSSPILITTSENSAKA